MALHTAIFGYLAASADFHAVAGDRIYPVRLPQLPTMPCVSYSIMSDPRHCLDGATYQHSRIQFNCWAETYLQVKSVAETIKALLNGFRGTMNSEEKIDSCLVISELDQFESNVDIFQEILEFSIWHKSV